MMEATTTQRQVTYGGLGWAVEGMGEVGPVLMPRSCLCELGHLFVLSFRKTFILSMHFHHSWARRRRGGKETFTPQIFMVGTGLPHTRPAKSAGDARRVPPTGYSPVE